MQLKGTATLLGALATITASPRALAQQAGAVADVETTQAVYHEAPTATRMTVYAPQVDVSATPASWITARAGYDADVVSGASVAVKAGAAYAASRGGADVISVASVRDTRHVGRGGVTLRNGDQTLVVGYAYGTENDYRSQGLAVSARTEAFDHNTQLELGYAKGLDSVCDRVQGAGEPPSRKVALEDAQGCFTVNAPLRTTRAVDTDGFQATWTQAWTPALATQLGWTSQIIHGFQGNPYRSVILGPGQKAQEHVPENRARHAASLRVKWFLRPVKAVLHLSLRAYGDTWGVGSGAAELELEKYLGEVFRLAARLRVYRQSGARFFSDDYSGGDPPLGPKGQYFTGDRELSPMESGLLGLRAVYTRAMTEGRLLGLFTGVRTSLGADVTQFRYDDYTLGGRPVGNARGYLGSFNLLLSF